LRKLHGDVPASRPAEQEEQDDREDDTGTIHEPGKTHLFLREVLGRIVQ